MLFLDMINMSGAEIMENEINLNFEVNKLSYNSNQVEKGDVFFALKGYKTDGNKFIIDALAKRAGAVITDKLDGNGKENIFHVPDARIAMAEMSSAYYDFPSRKMKMIGVTGTNGKTTVTNIINHVLQLAGKATGMIGTNGNMINKKFYETKFTTPESVDLNELLNRMVKEYVEIAVMEVSSHALELKRVYGIDYDTIVFTNLTPEHLDFHKTIENYFSAKKILFDSASRINKKYNRTNAIYNIDDDFGKKIVKDCESERISFGFGKASYSLENLKMTFAGMQFDMLVPLNGEGIDKIAIETKLTGRFNVYNILAASAALHSVGINYKTIKKALKQFEPVDGRFNQIKLANGAVAIIDYSHTPDSLLKALSAIKEIKDAMNSAGKIITVFGCGGDRDRLKRPIMGEIASKYSNEIIITSDNPRTEDPMKIIEEIKKGITSDNYKIEADRQKAIEIACKEAADGDIILIAGKGHETYQEINGVRHHLSDKEIAQKFV
jgi:UDP-N-acetylmuramoyl-L-alanyl-D-glutamate--2,6-diaminopimelate ligase